VKKIVNLHYNLLYISVCHGSFCNIIFSQWSACDRVSALIDTTLFISRSTCELVLFAFALTFLAINMFLRIYHCKTCNLQELKKNYKYHITEKLFFRIKKDNNQKYSTQIFAIVRILFFRQLIHLFSFPSFQRIT